MNKMKIVVNLNMQSFCNFIHIPFLDLSAGSPALGGREDLAAVAGGP